MFTKCHSTLFRVHSILGILATMFESAGQMDPIGTINCFCPVLVRRTTTWCNTIVSLYLKFQITFPELLPSQIIHISFFGTKRPPPSKWSKNDKHDFHNSEFKILKDLWAITLGRVSYKLVDTYRINLSHLVYFCVSKGTLFMRKWFCKYLTWSMYNCQIILTK